MKTNSNGRQPQKTKAEYHNNHSIDCEWVLSGNLEENSSVALLSPACLLCFHLSFHAMVSCAIHKNQVSIKLNRNKNTFWYYIWKSDCSVKFKTFLELLTCISGNKPSFKWSSFSIENLAAQNLEEFKWHNTVYFLSAVLLLIANCNYWFRDFPQ